MKRSALLFVSLFIACASALAADSVIITEFMARNDTVITDEDNDHEDWIEIFNAGAISVNLLNWSLTDTAGNLAKWHFPAANIAAGQFMIVWASNKDRRHPGAPLHTNFKLNDGGEYLALVRPDGSIAQHFSPAFPQQAPNVSYGVAVQQTPLPMVTNGSPARILVPANDSLAATWTQNGFGDSGWLAATNGLGFQQSDPPVTPAAVLADSAAEFSSTQGQNNWYYGYWDKSADLDGVYAPAEFAVMGWDGSKWAVGGNPPWTQLNSNGGHPNRDPQWQYTVRRWVSEVDGLVRLVGYLSAGPGCGGDGVDIKIWVDGVLVHSGTALGSTDEFAVNARVTVGSKVDFGVGPNTANDWCDSFNFGVRILQGALADSVEDWSTAGQQGSRGWIYGYYDKASDGDGIYQTNNFTAFTSGQWLSGKWDLAANTAPWTEVNSTGGHPASGPGEQWAMRRWTSSYAGKVLLSCRLGHQGGCGGGVMARIFKDGQQVQARAISGGAVGCWLPLDVSVGTILDFAIDPNGDDGCDMTSFMVRIQEARASLFRVADSEYEWIGGAQGANNWYYGYYNRGADGDGVYDPLTDYKDSTTDANWVFTGEWHFGAPTYPPWTGIGPTWGHPNGYNSPGGENWAIQRWVSKFNGPVSIAWNHRKQNGGGGTTIKVFKNGQVVGSTVIWGDFVGVNNIVSTVVATNDILDFALTPIAPDGSSEDWGDGSQFNTVIFGSGYDTAATSTLLADSRADWSGSGAQGYRNWYYGYYNKTADGNGVYEAATDFNMTDPNWIWTGIWELGPGNPPWNMIGADWGHPNGINNGAEDWSIRRWVSTHTGTLRVDWSLAKQGNGGSGVTGAIYRNGALVDSYTIPGWDTTGVNRSASIFGVQAGDFIDIVLSPIGPGGATDDGADASYFYASIYALDRSVNTLVADSMADWSPSGQQGYKGWSYGLYNLTGDGDGIYQAADFVSASADWNFTGSQWELGYNGNMFANPPWNTITQTGGHPNGTNNAAEVWSIRRWTCTFSGSATVNWKLSAAATCGAGTTARLFHNGTPVDAGTIAGNDTTGLNRTVTLASVVLGDTLDLALTPQGADGSGHDGCDSANFSISIYRRGEFPAHFTSDVSSLMAGSNATIYARFPFSVTDPAAINLLKLNITYDDGFVAYLNGVEVARRNAPSYQAGGVLANSINEFSSTQGANNWFHGYYDKTADLNGIYETSDFSTGGSWYWIGWGWALGGWPPYTQLDNFYSHPNGSNNGHEQWTLRRWVCETAGSIRLSLHGKKDNPNCGNGVTFRVFHNGTSIYTRTIEFWDSTGFTTSLTLASVQVGDLIDVALDPTGVNGVAEDGCDGSRFAVTVDQEPMPALTWNSRATAARPDAQSLVAEEIDLTGFRSLLAAGNNVLAIQGLNVSQFDSDFLLTPELTGTTVTPQTNNLVYFTQSTPGAINGLGTTNLGPLITDLTFSPKQPLGTNDLLVTARTTVTLNPVGSMVLRYRVMYGSEHELPMFDDGAHGDGAAGDGVWGATIPVASAATAGQMVRWYFVATDSLGNPTRNPAYFDIYNSPQYHGTMVRDSAVVSQLPVLYWFVQNPTAANNYSGTRCSIYFDGEFYDNINAHMHGQSTTGFSKKSYGFDLNSGYHLSYDNNQPKLEEFVVFSTYADKAHLRNVLSFDAYADAGAPAHFAFPVRVQQNGQFYSLGNFGENGNSHFLDRLGLDPRGAFYKLYNWLNSSTANVEKKTRRDEDNSDLQTLINNLNVGDENARKTYMFDNLDIAEMVNYVATRIPLTSDYDWGHKNYYLYRDTLGTGEWQAMPQDVDLSIGHNWSDTLGYFDDNIYTNSNIYAGNNVLFDQFKYVEPFRTMWLRRIRTLMDTVLQPPETPLSNDVWHARMNAYAGRMAPEATLDLALWNPNWGFGAQTLTQALQRIDSTYPTNYLPGRRAYLFHTLSVTNGGPIPLAQSAGLFLSIGTVEFNPASGNQAQEYIQINNTNSEAMDISGWRMDGGISHTFKPGTVILPGTSLYLAKDVVAFRARSVSPKGGEQRFVQGNFNGQLSARGETLVMVDRAGQTNTTLAYAGSPSLAQQYLRVTELMYNPAPLAGNTNDAQNFEFIELKNISSTETLDLTGVRFTAGVEFSFTASAVTSLAPGQRVLVVKSSSAFTARYGSGFSIAGDFSGSLENNGECLTLLDAANEEFLDFTYSDAWYPITDGAGFSLVIVNENAEPDAWNWKTQWRPSGTEGGSPGTGDTLLPTVAAILVTEALTHTDLPATDTIELFNPTGSAVDIGGWFLTDNFALPKKFRIPSPTIIPAGCYVTFDETNFNNGGTGLAFSSTGEEVYLFSGDASTNLTGYWHGFQFGAAANGVTFGRYVNSQGEEHFVAQSANTLGTNNALPRVGPLVFNQIMYHPPDLGTNDNSQHEYIQLLNISGAALSLYDPAHPANAWRLRGGADFDFPPGVTIPANGTILLVNFDPVRDLLALADFRAHYGISATVPMFGPYSGKLANDGETLELQRPDLPNGTNVPHIVVETVKYGAAAPWPVTPDGHGAALQRLVTTSYANDPTNWVATTTLLPFVVTGQVAMEAYTGLARDGAGTRDVVFKATDNAGTVLMTWTSTLPFAIGPYGYGVANYTLSGLPAQATHLSAKTAWHLRVRLPITLTGSSGQAIFSGMETLPCGDLDGSNLVDTGDYFLFASAWYQAVPTADFDGSGFVDLDDYFLMSNHWLENGDAE